MTPKLAIICSHPIQYYTPVFSMLAQHIDLKVFYTRGNHNYDKCFNLEIEWNIPLLEGYDYVFLNNTAKNPGTHQFFGIINPGAGKIIGEFAPTHILIYGWAFYSHFKLLLHFNNRAIILFRGDSNLLKPMSTLRSMIKKQLLKYVYKHVDLVLFAGTQNKAYYKAYELTEQQLIFVPHAVDNLRFSYSAKNSEIRTQLGLRQDDILILFTGKFIPLKNPELLIKAFQTLDLPEVHLLLVGDGLLASQLQTRYQSERIHFLPFQNQLSMPAIYQSCDLFCMPSRNESWGLAVNEAMAAGKAVIVSDRVGCAKDLIQDSNGLIFQSDNILDLQQKLKRLCKSRVQLQTMGQSSKSIIERWNFDTQVNSIINALSL